MTKIKYSIVAISLLQSISWATTDLGDIIVTSVNKTAQKVKKTTANVKVITAKEIKEKGYQSVPEALSHLAGINFASNGGIGQSTSIFIRGLKSDNLLILIDGVPMTDYSQPTPSAAIEHIDINSIDKIEIVKGGQSAVWGANAAAGTINIITKGSQNKNSIYIKAGSHNTKGAGFDISKSNQKGSIYLGANILKSDGISALSGANAEPDGYENKNIHLKASYNINNSSKVYLFAHAYKAKFDYDTGSADDKSSNGTSDQYLYGAGYKYHNDKLSINAKVAKKDIERVYNSPFGKFDTNATSTILSLTSSYDFTANSKLTLGFEHNKNSSSAGGFAPSKASFTNNNAFISYTHTFEDLLGAKTILNSTLRYDQFDKFANKATYKFGFKRECNILPGLHTDGSIYTGYKAPSLYQLSGSTGDLKPESLKGYELSIGYKKLLNITYFSNQIQDRIVGAFDPATFTTKYSNQGSGAKTTGVEISSEIALNDSIVIGANLTHMFKYQDTTGKDLVRIPQNSINAYLDWYFEENSHIGIIAHYIGARRDITYDPITYTPSDVTLKSYTTIDLTYGTKLTNNLSLSATVKNILNTKYETIKGYSTEGRSIYGKLEYRF